MKIKIYSSPGCFYCEQARELCERVGREYETITVGKDISRAEFQELFPNVNQYPHIIVDGNVIGGAGKFQGHLARFGVIERDIGPSKASKLAKDLFDLYKTSN